MLCSIYELMLLGINFVACSPTSSTPSQLELFKVSFIVYLWPMLSGSLFILQFFTTKPLPCDPSCLPKYPPSKEFDAKLRDEEARRWACLQFSFPIYFGSGASYFFYQLLECLIKVGSNTFYTIEQCNDIDDLLLLNGRNRGCQHVIWGKRLSEGYRVIWEKLITINILFSIFLSKKFARWDLCTQAYLVLAFCRQGAASRAHRGDPEKRGTKESRAIPAPDANAELAVSMQVIYFLLFILLYFFSCLWFFCSFVFLDYLLDAQSGPEIMRFSSGILSWYSLHV